MDQIIFTEDFVNGILFCFLVGGGLLIIFVVVSLAMLWFYDPRQNE